jgi:nucleotide-binding universal stress UspA family protein
MKSELLITTNGFKGTWPAIEYGAWVASVIDANVTLLGVTENLSPAAIDDHHPLEDVFEKAVELFQSGNIHYTLEVQNGDAEEIIPRKTRERDYITVIGPLGRPQIKRMLTGRSIRHLMEQIEKPILYVPQMKLPLKKVLICIGGLGYEITAENIAMNMAIKSKAEITLMHIVPPMDLDYPAARTVRDNWQSLAKTDTAIGRSLRQGLELAESNGLPAQVKARQGHIVEEILSELKEENYDLLCMGSPYSANALRQMYAPNVTAEVAETSHIPILTARHKRQD